MPRSALLHTLEERVRPQGAALLVLDMLKADPDAPPSRENPRVSGPLERLIRLISAGRQVSLPIIYVRNSHSPWTMLPNLLQAWSSKPGHQALHYAEGTRAVEFHDGIDPGPGEATLIKHSYSAFAHGPLDLMLRSRGIESVMLTGGAPMGAVEAAAKDCFVRGYYLVIVQDCLVPSAGPDVDMVTYKAADRLGAEVLSSDEIISVWRKMTREEAYLPR